jgi:hypothetical protein
MDNTRRFLFYILLPVVALLCYPPATLLNGIVGIIGALIFIALLGWMVWRGRSLALTLLILSQGFNVIIRLMMLMPNSISETGVWNPAYIITSLVGLVLSFWLMLRLDKADVRSQMVA